MTLNEQKKLSGDHNNRLNKIKLKFNQNSENDFIQAENDIKQSTKSNVADTANDHFK